METCKVCVIPEWIIDCVIENGIVKMIHENGKIENLTELDDFTFLAMEAFEVIGKLWKDGKWGLVDVHTGEIIVQPIWDYVEEFYDGCGVIGKGCEPTSCEQAIIGESPYGGKFGTIDHGGNIVIPVEYDSLEPRKRMDSYICIARKDGRCGVLDSEGKVILPIEYGDIEIINQSAYLCLKSEGICYVYNGETIFEGASAVYVPKNPFEWRNKHFIACKDKKYSVFSTDGRMLSGFTFLLREAKEVVKILDGTTQFKKLNCYN